MLRRRRTVTIQRDAKGWFPARLKAITGSKGELEKTFRRIRLLRDPVPDSNPTPAAHVAANASLLWVRDSVSS